MPASNQHEIAFSVSDLLRISTQIGLFLPSPDLEFSESEENNDYETLHLGKGVDFLANVTKQNFTDSPTGKNINLL